MLKIWEKIFTSNQRLHLKGFCHYRERHHNALWNSLESGLFTTLFHYQSVKIKTLTTIGHLIEWSEILMGVLQLSISLLLSADFDREKDNKFCMNIKVHSSVCLGRITSFTYQIFVYYIKYKSDVQNMLKIIENFY